MPSSEKVISPGVFTNEIDQTFLPAAVGDIGAALIGPTVKGPPLIPTVVNSYSEFKTMINKGAFIQTTWDGNTDTESAIKKETNATIRCIMFNSNIKNKKCIYSSNPAKHEVIFAKAY